MSLARRVLFFFRNPADRTPDALPDFPLRCQHCEAAIRLAVPHPADLMRPSGTLFRDESGHIACDPAHRILHRPMPSVL